MPRFGLPHSVRKFLRREKARIRREYSDAAEAEKKIMELAREVRARSGRKVRDDKHSKERVV